MNPRRKPRNRTHTVNAEQAPRNASAAPIAPLRFPARAETSHSELLILPDGRILVHNLTRAFADLLHDLNPEGTQIAARARRVTHYASRYKSHELPG